MLESGASGKISAPFAHLLFVLLSLQPTFFCGLIVLASELQRRAQESRCPTATDFLAASLTERLVLS
jgi:hypothetical protein